MPTTVFYLLSLHDALPIYGTTTAGEFDVESFRRAVEITTLGQEIIVGNAKYPTKKIEANSHRLDRKSTRLNSSHGSISYAVFCLKKKNRPIHARTGHARAV